MSIEELGARIYGTKRLGLRKSKTGPRGGDKEDGVLGCDRERDDLNERTLDMISQQDLEPRNQRNESQNLILKRRARLNYVMLIILQ